MNLIGKILVLLIVIMCIVFMGLAFLILARRFLSVFAGLERSQKVIVRVFLWPPVAFVLRRVGSVIEKAAST